MTVNGPRMAANIRLEATACPRMYYLSADVRQMSDRTDSVVAFGLRGAPRTHTIASSTRICGPFTAIRVLLFGNVNDREWSANARKYSLRGDGLSANGRKYALGDDGLSAYVLSVRRCKTDVRQNRFCRSSRASRCIPNAHHHIIHTHLRTIHGNSRSSLWERK